MNIEEIKQFINSVSLVTDNDLDNLFSCRNSMLLKARDYFIQESEVCNKIAFIHSGTFSFLILKDNKEYVKDFSIDKKFLTAYTSFITQTPSKVYIRAEADAELTFWNYKDFNQVVTSNSNWLKFHLKMANYLYIRKEQREVNLLTKSAEERYLSMLKEYPEINNKVPQYLTASYLGITPESLSRIRKNLTDKRHRN